MFGSGETAAIGPAPARGGGDERGHHVPGRGTVP